MVAWIGQCVLTLYIIYSGTSSISFGPLGAGYLLHAWHKNLLREQKSSCKKKKKLYWSNMDSYKLQLLHYNLCSKIVTSKLTMYFYECRVLYKLKHWCRGVILNCNSNISEYQGEKFLLMFNKLLNERKEQTFPNTISLLSRFPQGTFAFFSGQE